VVEARRRVDGDPMRQKLLGAINAAPFDLDGVAPSRGPDENQGADRVFLTIMQAGGSLKPVARLIEMPRQ